MLLIIISQSCETPCSSPLEVETELVKASSSEGGGMKGASSPLPSSETVRWGEAFDKNLLVTSNSFLN